MQSLTNSQATRLLEEQRPVKVERTSLGAIWTFPGGLCLDFAVVADEVRWEMWVEMPDEADEREAA